MMDKVDDDPISDFIFVKPEDWDDVRFDPEYETVAVDAHLYARKRVLPPPPPITITHIDTTVYPDLEDAVDMFMERFKGWDEARILAALGVPSNTPEWLAIRRLRCGASGASGACDGTHVLTGEKWVDDAIGGSFEGFVHDCLYPDRFKGNVATAQGHKNEPHAIDRGVAWTLAWLEEETGKKVAAHWVFQEGAFVNVDYPFIHATSDFSLVVKFEDGTGTAFNGEAKCPMSPTGYGGKVKPAHYHQMQQQMGTYARRLPALAKAHGVVLPLDWVMKTVYTVYSARSGKSWVQLVDFDPVFYLVQCQVVAVAHREMMRRYALFMAGFIRYPETLPVAAGADGGVAADLAIELDLEGEDLALAEETRAAEADVTSSTMALLGLV